MAEKEITEPGFDVLLPEGVTRFFPLVNVDKFKQGDIRMIMAVTGVDFDDVWLPTLQKDGLNDALVLQGFLAVAIQRARQADHDQVVSFIDELPLVGGITLRFPKVEDDAVPPAPEPDVTAT